MENLSKGQKITIITIAVIMIAVVVYYFMHKTKEYDSLDINEMVQSENNEVVEEAKEEEEQVLIVVHITGEVKKEGVVSILEGARITDVINKARRSNRNSRFIKSKFSIYSKGCR